MKISLNWLKDYIDSELPLEELCHKLTMAGLEVEKVENVDGDTVIEMEITPNRSDCLNVIGIAREVGAILNKDVRSPEICDRTFPQIPVDISIEDKDGCAAYMGTVIKDVRVKSSEKNIRERLLSLGFRCINNIVDITNFCLLETGQPMHAFDYDKLYGGKIVVRRAKKGEKILTIDDVERDLDPSVLVIADEKRPVAIAGIMGGKETEVTDETKNILLESAYFDPILIRRASRKLGLSSESSYRFERGVDPQMVVTAANRALDLLEKSSQGKITDYAHVVARNVFTKERTIEVSVEAINKYVGADIEEEKCKNILTRLDFSVEGGALLSVTPPSFRDDVKRPVDLIEEIARVLGYDNLPLSVPHVRMSNIPVDLRRKRRAKLRSALCAQGLNEVITYTMISRDLLKKAKSNDKQVVSIQNPLTVDQEIMRSSLLPSLLLVASVNIKKMQKDLKLFEIGKSYREEGEREILGIIMTGRREDHWQDEKKKQIDFYDIKGALQTALTALKVPEQDISFSSTDETFCESGAAARVFFKKKDIGVVGKIRAEVLRDFEIKRGEVFFAEIDLQDIYSLEETCKEFISISEYPSVTRDISLAVKQDIPSQNIVSLIWEKAPDAQSPIALASVKFIEKYEGDKIPSGQRGLVYSLEYQSKTQTLTDQAVDSVHEKICSALVEKLGVVRR